MTDSGETRWESYQEAGRRYFAEGDDAKAEQAFTAAIREASLLGADDVRLATSVSSLAQLKYRQKDLEQAEALFRRALAIRERVLGEKHPDVAVTMNSLARLYFRRNDYAAAAPLLLRLLAIKQETAGAHHPEVAVILTSLAKVRLAEGDHEAAEQLARRALVIREEVHPPNDPAIATSLEVLADVVGLRGNREEEWKLRERARAMREHASGAGNLAPTQPLSASPEVPGQSQAWPEAGRGALASPAAPPSSAPPPPTTKSVSLPWIEPPTSPALRRPAPRQDFALRPPRPSSAPAPSAPPSRSPAPPPAPRASAGGRPVRSRSGHREAPAEPRRSWGKLVAAAVVLVAVGAGAWIVHTRGSDVTGDEVAGSMQPVQPAPRPSKPPVNDAKPATNEPPAGGPQVAETAPPAPPATDTLATRSAVARTTPVGESTAGAKERSPRSAPPPEPVLPKINVDRVTNDITQKARARIDSVGRTITVKPPSFEKPPTVEKPPLTFDDPA